MADRVPNPDLWTVKTGPHQPLVEIFYTQSFIQKSNTFNRSFSSTVLLPIKLLLSYIAMYSILELSLLFFQSK